MFYDWVGRKSMIKKCFRRPDCNNMVIKIISINVADGLYCGNVFRWAVLINIVFCYVISLAVEIHGTQIIMTAQIYFVYFGLSHSDENVLICSYFMTER